MAGAGQLAGVGHRVRRIIYGDLDPAALITELRPITEIDLAHVVMLSECGLLDRASAAKLLTVVGELREDGFSALHGTPAPRGVYLMYEHYLADRLGADIGGRLHTGRSRNDVKATVTALRARRWSIGFVADAIRLQAVLLARARAHRTAVMPVHTHHQAAMPITYAHYLAGVAVALGRDIAAVRYAAEAFGHCPMGAAAVAGSDLPVDPVRVARLLGFAHPVRHSIDAVASRDGLVRLLGTVAVAGITLSRLAADLQLWSTSEFGFVVFPDRLVGGSSAMPQKRNAFLLEHVKAKAGLAIGAWTAAAATTKSAPFTNSIEVGTEAVAAVWPGLTAVADAVVLAGLLVSGARPVPDLMRRRAETGFVTATALANRLVRDGVPFRTAHELVGDAVRGAAERGETRAVVTGPFGPVTPPELEEAVAQAHSGGGPGAVAEMLEHLRADLAEHAAWVARERGTESEADGRLRSAVAELTGRAL